MEDLSFLICNLGVVIPSRPGAEQLGETTEEKADGAVRVMGGQSQKEGGRYHGLKMYHLECASPMQAAQGLG